MRYTVEFHTNDYVMSHGHNPRGYGSWAFSFERNAHVDDMFWVHASTYGDAKKKVREYVKGKDPQVSHVMVYVGT